MRKDPDKFINLCNEKVIAIVANGNDFRFLPKNPINRHKEQAKEIKGFLYENYDIENYEYGQIEFGQPFLSYEEAYAFVKHYRPRNEEAEIHRHLEQYLILARKEPYVYELPNQKKYWDFCDSKATLGI